MTEPMSQNSSGQGPAFWSYGFRPFFLSAALFAGIAIPFWVLIFTGLDGVEFFYAPRDWHVHEMIFGFLPCVITGFVLTAIPNWTERPPMKGMPLMLLVSLWLTARLAMFLPWVPPLVLAMIDGAFLVIVAGVVWREIVIAKVWGRLPIGVLISLYAMANLVFHVLWQNGQTTDVAERMALALIMLLLALIGGKITPGFTEDFLEQAGVTKQPAAFSLFDGLSIVLIGLAGMAWVVNPASLLAGLAFVTAGVIHLARLVRWYGWLTWREPLVLILHVGYGWLAMAFLLLGTSILGVGLAPEHAIHALTTGAVGVMTLGVMTRASLGHTGHTKHAGPSTMLIYLLVNLGAVIRTFGSSLHFQTDVSLGLAAACWSGAYLLFVGVYGRILLAPSLEETSES